MRSCIRNQPALHAHVVAAPVAPPAPPAAVFSAPPTGGSVYNGVYGYGGGDGSYSGCPYDHGGRGDANYEAVSVGQSPGACAGAGHDIPSRPPGALYGGYHRAMQQAGNGEDGVAFAAEDGGHEDEGYFDSPLSSVLGGPESGHGPTAYVQQLPTSGRSSGTGCDIPRFPPQYSDSNNGYGTNRGPQQQCGSGSRSYRAKPFVRHYRGGDGPLSGTLSPPAAVISDSAFEEWLQSNEMEMPMFSLSKGQWQQPPNSAASDGGAPASSAVAAASAEPSAAESATSGTVPSAASVGGAVDARGSSARAVSSDTAAEAATSTGGTAFPVVLAARAAGAFASTAGSADDSWAWPISQGRLRFYPRKRVPVRRLPPRPRPIPRSSATCARLAHSRSWGGHSNEGSALSRPGG